MSKRSVLLLDIETSPFVGYTWGKYEQNVIEFTQQSYILSVAYCWLGERVRVIALDDHDEKDLLRKISDLLSSCQVAVAHNGDKFDFRKLNTRFVIHRMKPPANYRTVDTRKIARQRFSFPSNSLNDLGRDLGLGQKMKHEGFSLWKRCMDGERAAFRQMKRYNVQDVVLLEKIYRRFKPWIKVEPVSSDPCCKAKRLTRRGYDITRLGVFQRLQCQGCGHWERGETVKGAISSASWKSKTVNHNI